MYTINSFVTRYVWLATILLKKKSFSLCCWASSSYSDAKGQDFCGHRQMSICLFDNFWVQANGHLPIWLFLGMCMDFHNGCWYFCGLGHKYKNLQPMWVFFGHEHKGHLIFCNLAALVSNARSPFPSLSSTHKTFGWRISNVTLNALNEGQFN